MSDLVLELLSQLKSDKMHLLKASPINVIFLLLFINVNSCVKTYINFRKKIIKNECLPSWWQPPPQPCPSYAGIIGRIPAFHELLRMGGWSNWRATFYQVFKTYDQFCFLLLYIRRHRFSLLSLFSNFSLTHTILFF